MRVLQSFQLHSGARMNTQKNARLTANGVLRSLNQKNQNYAKGHAGWRTLSFYTAIASKKHRLICWEAKDAATHVMSDQKFRLKLTPTRLSFAVSGSSAADTAAGGTNLSRHSLLKARSGRTTGADM